MDRRPESWLRNTEAVLIVGAIVVVALAYGVARLLGLN
jgi:hypothetical protein